MGEPLSTGAEEYLVWLEVERGRARNTLSAYRRDLTAWERWLDDVGVPPLAVDPEHVDRYQEHLRVLGRSPSSVARVVTTLRGQYRFLVDEGSLAVDPTAEARTPRPPRRLPKALDEADTVRLLESVRGTTPIDLRDRALLELLYGTGARISEVVGLSLGDLKTDDGLIRVMGKGSKERLVPLGSVASRALGGWLAAAGRPALVPDRWARRSDAEAVFLNTRGARLSRQGAWAALKHRAAGVGLADRVSPHVLRHSCASDMLAHGADIRVVQELLGHVSITTTQLYTNVSPEHLRSAYERAHP